MTEVKIPLFSREGVSDFATIDVEDFKRLVKSSWHKTAQGYACSKKLGLMHRYIMEAPSDFEVDHINRDKLDNRKSNLRLASRSLNSYNTPERGGTSKYRGVARNKNAQKWQAYFHNQGDYYYIGLFDDEAEAAKARDSVAKYFADGEAILNFEDVKPLSPEHFMAQQASKYRGVNLSRRKGNGRTAYVWRSRITFDGERRHLGSFKSEHAAALAYNEAAEKLFGDSAKINIIEGEDRIICNPPARVHLPSKRGDSKYTGIVWSKSQKAWKARFTFNGITYSAGYHNDEIQAAKARDMVAKFIYSEAYLNFPEVEAKSPEEVRAMFKRSRQKRE